jgi:uncharacterized membrane protein YedE/YeeE
MIVRSPGMLVRLLAVFVRRSRVLLRLFVFALLVIVGRLMVVMRGGVMVSRRLVVILSRRMLRWLSHLCVLPTQSFSAARVGDRLRKWQC